MTRHLEASLKTSPFNSTSNYVATVSNTSSVEVSFDLASSAGVFWGSFRGSLHWEGVPWAPGL